MQFETKTLKKIVSKVLEMPKVHSFYMLGSQLELRNVIVTKLLSKALSLTISCSIWDVGLAQDKLIDQIYLQCSRF